MSENDSRFYHQPQKHTASAGLEGVIPIRSRRPATGGTTFDLVPILMAKKHKDRFMRRVDAAIEELKESFPLSKTG
jgi:hypothetical protein